MLFLQVSVSVFTRGRKGYTLSFSAERLSSAAFGGPGADFFSLISVTQATPSLLVNCLLGPLARAASEGLSPPFCGYVGHWFLPNVVPRILPSHCLPRLHNRSLTLNIDVSGAFRIPSDPGP